MIKFNLEKALNGAKVITRDGREASQVTLFDTSNEEWALFAVVDGEVLSYLKNGNFKHSDDPHELDLFIAPEMLSGFVNVFNDNNITSYAIHKTKEQADMAALSYRIACIDLSQFPVGYGLEDE